MRVKKTVRELMPQRIMMQPEMQIAVPVFMARNLTAKPEEIKGPPQAGCDGPRAQLDGASLISGTGCWSAGLYSGVAGVAGSCAFMIACAASSAAITSGMA